MKKWAVLFILMLFIVSGCAYFNKGASKDEPAAAPKYEQLNQTYYGFPDIPVPKELRFISEKSFVYETPSLRAGVLVLRGNVELQSLENYFKINMIKNGWTFVNSFKFKDVTLNFTKEDKTCNIKMVKESFDAEVEIWVGPSASMNPAPASTEKKLPQKGNVYK